MQNIKIVIA